MEEEDQPGCWCLVVAICSPKLVVSDPVCWRLDEINEQVATPIRLGSAAQRVSVVFFRIMQEVCRWLRRVTALALGGSRDPS